VDHLLWKMVARARFVGLRRGGSAARFVIVSVAAIIVLTLSRFANPHLEVFSLAIMLRSSLW